MSLPEGISSFTVTYYNPEDLSEKETVTVRPVPLSKLKDFKTLYEQLIDYFVEKTGSTIELITDDKCLEVMKAISKMVPVVGKTEGIDLDNLLNAGAYLQITNIFFAQTGSFEQTDNAYYPDYVREPKPGLLARLHDYHFSMVVAKKREQKLQEELEKEQESKKQKAAVKSK